MNILRTDDEISAAIDTWLDAHPQLPREAERIARFVYGDGTGGHVTYRFDAGSFERDTPGLGEHFVYHLASAKGLVSLMFTPEFFQDSAVPVIPLLHRQAANDLSRPIEMRTVAD